MIRKKFAKYLRKSREEKDLPTDVVLQSHNAILDEVCKRMNIFVDEEDTFKDIEGNAVSGNNFFIKFKNIYCALGYECNNKDINTEKLFVYPVDGLRYDFSSEINK